MTYNVSSIGQLKGLELAEVRRSISKNNLGSP